jgi:hypothetical protein
MIDGDFDTLDKLLGDGLVYTHSTGQSDTHAEYIAKCKKGVFKYRKIERNAAPAAVISCPMWINWRGRRHAAAPTERRDRYPGEFQCRMV